MGSGDITKEHDKLDRVLAEIAELRAIMNGFGNALASVKTDVAEPSHLGFAPKTSLA